MFPAVLLIGKEVRVIYYYDQTGKITRYITYRDCGSEAEAKKQYEESLNPEYESFTDSEIKRLFVAGKYLGFT